MVLGNGIDAELMQTAVQAALAGGDVLKKWFRKVSARSKTCSADIVTEADEAAQKVIHDVIVHQFPEHHLLGEENLNKAVGNNPYRWIIDPLDGTSNYFHGYPYFAVSIGVEWKGEIHAGVIYDPTRDEMFTALKEHGAYLNDEKLSVSQIQQLDQSFLVASFPPGARPDSLPIQQFLKILPHAQTIQRTGSAALNLAYVATGRVDGFWSYSLKPWDMAAGVLIVREAGGLVTKMSGGEFSLDIPDMLATNGKIHATLRDLLTTPIS